MRVVVVGAGIAGAVAARLLRAEGHHVEVFECRPHIAGNCYDSWLNGILVHNYGPHGFHTDNEEVWRFLQDFTSFNDVALSVWANTKRGLIPVPFNKESADLVGELTPVEIRELVFVEYSEKQWGIPWEQLPDSITSRVPLKRDSYDGRYHLDRWQGVPKQGYTAMFEAMFEGIPVHLNCSATAWKAAQRDELIFTGSIDEYFDQCYGALEYRSLRFEHAQHPRRSLFQINECNSQNPWTRSIDHSFWLGQNIEQTIITKEFPCEFDGHNGRFYPKRFNGNPTLYEAYADLTRHEQNVTFLGRLGTYKYLDMDDTVAQVFQMLRKKGAINP